MRVQSGAVKSALKSAALIAAAFAVGLGAAGSAAFPQGSTTPCNVIPMTGVTYIAPAPVRFDGEVAAYMVGCADGSVHHVVLMSTGSLRVGGIYGGQVC